MSENKARADRPEKPEVKLTKQELQNLINLVATHPTPGGVGSQDGNIKIQLVNKLSRMIEGGKETV